MSETPLALTSPLLRHCGNWCLPLANGKPTGAHLQWVPRHLVKGEINLGNSGLLNYIPEIQEIEEFTLNLEIMRFNGQK